MRDHVFGGRPSAMDTNPLRTRRGERWLARGIVLAAEPLTVRLFGDTDGTVVGLFLGGYSPTVGDPVVVGRIGSRLMVLGKVEQQEGPGPEPEPTPIASVPYGARLIEKDFYTVSPLVDKTLNGLASDGNLMWVANDTDNELWAYDLATHLPVTASNIDLTSQNSTPRGLAVFEGTMYVADAGSTYTYAYSISTGNRETGKEFNWVSGHSDFLGGMAVVGEELWIVESTGRYVRRYNLSTGAYISQITQTRAPFTVALVGLEAFGNVFWVASTQGRIGAFQVDTLARLPQFDINARAAGLGNCRALARVGTVLYVLGTTLDHILAFDVSMASA